MSPRPPTLIVATVTVVTMLVAACEAKVYGASSAKPVPTRSAAVTRLAQAIHPPEPTPSGLGELSSRIQQATVQAAADGATIAVAVFDRVTNQLVANGNEQIPGIASVAKLFIADELLLREAQGATLSAEDRTALDGMLRSSDDGAAEQFWAQLGGDAIITEVAGRYGLTDTAPPSDGRWWNTISTPADLIRYYRMLLDGSGGLPPERATTIINNLAQATTNGADGYPQRFGIPDGLPPNRSRSNRAGCAASTRTGCICRPESSAPTGATSWLSRRCSLQTTRPHAQPSPRQSRRCFPAGGFERPAGCSLRAEIRTPLAGALPGGLFAPGCDSGMVAGQQDLGHVEAPPARWPGVAGPFQQPRQPRGVRILLLAKPGLPSTPGSRRSTASIITSAADSPPGST